MTRMFPNEDDSPELAEAYRALWPTADLQEALLHIAATTLAHEAILLDELAWAKSPPILTRVPFRESDSP